MSGSSTHGKPFRVKVMDRKGNRFEKVKGKFAQTLGMTDKQIVEMVS